MEEFRRERERCKRYVYGDQWNDKVTVGKDTITERAFLKRQGQIPLSNNILRRILRNVVGLYRSQYKVPALSARDSDLDKTDLRELNRHRRRWFSENRMEELAPRLLEEFLISGIVAVKVQDGCILPVTPQNFFFTSNGYDPRGEDLEMVGEVHHVSRQSVIERFCKSAEDYRRIKSLFGTAADSLCRVVEVWHKETRFFGVIHNPEKGSLAIENLDELTERLDREKDEGNKTEKMKNIHTVCRTVWQRTWFAPDGSVLAESEEERHPYVFKAYPYIDGEVHSYISDLIDQQRYVNRLITLYDFIMKSSAKGVLLFPDESIPDGMDLQGVANEWSCFNGVIPYKAKPGIPAPTQVSTNGTNIGITELLKIEMQMLEDISGVSPTLQGKLQTNSTSGTLFAQQNAAAQTSLLDVIRTFSDFLSALLLKTPTHKTC